MPSPPPWAALPSGLGTQLKGALTGIWEGLKALGDILGPILIPLLTAAGQAIGGALVLGLLALQAALLTVVPPLVFLASVMKDIASGSIPDLAKANEAANASFAKLEVGLKASATAAGQMAGVLPKVADESEKAATGTGNLGKNLTEVGKAAGPTAAELKKVADEAEKITAALKKAQAQFDAMNMTAEEKKAKALADSYEDLAKSVEKLGGPKGVEAARIIREIGVEAGKIEDKTKAWKDFDKILEDIDDSLKDLAPPLRTTTELTKGLGLAIPLDKIDDLNAELIRLSIALQPLPAPLNTITQEMEDLASAATKGVVPLKETALIFALLNDTTEKLVTPLKAVSPALHSLSLSAEDAAVELSILDDTIEPLLMHMEDERWRKMGEGLTSAFLTVTDTFTKTVDGLIAGTLDIETAFTNLGQSLYANFTQFALHEIFDPVLKKSGEFAAQLLRDFSSGDWAKIGDTLKATFGPLFGFDPNAPGSGMEGMGPWQPNAGGLEMFSIDNLLSAQTVLSGILILMQSISLIAEGKTGQGIGTLIGGALGTAVGAYYGGPAGAAVGGQVGAQAGGMIGGLFDEPDMSAIIAARRLQAKKTSQTAAQDAAKELFKADDLGELAQQFGQKLAGTRSTIGGVILNMVENDLTDLESKDAQRIEKFLRGAGFEIEEFAQNRIGSVKDLLKEAGPEWDTLLAGISQFLEILEDVWGTMTELDAASLKEFTASFSDVFEVLDVARMLEGLGFDEAAGKLRDRLRAIIRELGDSASIIGKITEAAFKLVKEDPTQLLRFIDVKPFKKAGEDIEDTTKRMRVSLEAVGVVLKSTNDALKGLEGGLGGASKGLNEAVTAANEADWQSMVDALNSADPSKWGAAVTEAHDLLLARYQAEIALIQEITVAIDTLGAAATTAVSTMSRLQDLGIKIPGAMDFASFVSTALSQSFAEGFTGRTPTMALTQGRSAVDVFAAQSMMAAKAMDLPGMEAAMKAAGNLVAGFTKQIDEINKIKDPVERMRLLREALDQVGDATEAAAQAAITYWTTLHNVVAGMMAQLNEIAASIAAAGNAIATNADWLKKAGVDIAALAKETLGLIDVFPTMAAKLELLGSGINLFLKGISDQEMERLKALGQRYLAATPGSPQQADFGAQISASLQPVLTGLFNSFQAAMNLQDPGQRLAALTNIMEQVGKLLGGMPPELADALTKMFGPEIKTLVDQMQKAGHEQAAQASKIADELKKIMGDKALSPENFLLLTVKGIQDSLDLIVKGAAPLFDAIAQGLVKAGGDINDAIKIAGKALSDALGGFKTPAEQLAQALNDLRTQIEQKMYDAVKKAIQDALSGSAQSGLDYVPKTGIYMLHPGESVINPHQSAAIRAGQGVYTASGYQAAGGGGVAVTLSFGDIHLARGGRQEAEEFITTVEASIKHGRLRGAVQRAAVGQA